MAIKGVNSSLLWFSKGREEEWEGADERERELLSHRAAFNSVIGGNFF